MSTFEQQQSNSNLQSQNDDNLQENKQDNNNQGQFEDGDNQDQQQYNEENNSQINENQEQDQDQQEEDYYDENNNNQSITSQQSLKKVQSVYQKQESNSQINSQSSLKQNQISDQSKLAQKSNSNNQIRNESSKNNIEPQKSQAEKINIDQMVLKCNIHRQDIVKVCAKKDCKEKMLFCIECIEEFAEHVVKHRPFIPIKQFLQELQDNPHTQRKERIEKLQKENSIYVKKILQQFNTEKTRIAQKSIPALKAALISLCDQLQSRIFDEIDQFSYVYQYNSKFLSSYLDQQGLLNEILDQVPSFDNLFKKYEENKGSKEAEFHEYLEKVYRKILNNSSVEKTKQAFGYFEEIFDNFRTQGDNAPQFIGEQALVEKVQQAFTQFIDNKDDRYSSIISQYPICSSCCKEVDSQTSSQQIQKQISELENQLKAIQKPGNSVSSVPTNKKDSISFASQNTPVSKVASFNNSKTEDIKSIQNEIDRLSKSKPGSCKGCRRLYCINCQNQSFCKGCKIVFDPNLKTSKFVIKESKGGQPMAMLDDTSKASSAVSLQGTIHGQSLKLQSISTQLKKLNVGLMLADQELYSGKYEWEVIIENFSSCHSIGFGLCKLDELQSDLNSNKDFKEIQDKSSLILVTSNGTISGGLKGRIQSFQKEKTAMAFNCLLDFGKNKFFIQGKNVYLERDLENNQGYIPCFYSGCCFKSYNNFVMKQKYQYDPIHIQK